jgi:hypothetical protein
MSQQTIALFLAIKGLSSRATHDELVTVLRPAASASSTVTKYLQQRHVPDIPIEDPEEASPTVVDDAILDALQHQPFSSVGELAKLTCLPRTTVHRRRTGTLRCIVPHLRSVPHSLTPLNGWMAMLEDGWR